MSVEIYRRKIFVVSALSKIPIRASEDWTLSTFSFAVRRDAHMSANRTF